MQIACAASELPAVLGASRWTSLNSLRLWPECAWPCPLTGVLKQHPQECFYELTDTGLLTAHVHCGLPAEFTRAVLAC